MVEQVLASVPSAWTENVGQLIVCAETSDATIVKFHKKERSMSVSGPGDAAALPAVLIELLSALSIIAQRGELPSRLGAQARAEHLVAAKAVLVKAGLQP